MELIDAHNSPARRQTGLRAAVVTTVLAATLALTGCQLLPTDNGLEPEVPAPAATEKAKPTTPATAGEAMASKVKASLGALAGTTKAPNREQMMSAMIAAGAAKEKVEVSIDITPTGLAVDAIEAATPVAKECVIGQVREGKVAVTVLPVLASGLCFVGDQH